jgi:phosphatidylethanolamine/phosphatidyl-N-methylethanolamine N-methyltransferase
VRPRRRHRESLQHANPLVAGIERLLAPLSRLLGFHPDFPLENFLQETGLEVSEQIPVNALGYWTLLRARNNKVPTATAAHKYAAPRMRVV